MNIRKSIWLGLIFVVMIGVGVFGYKVWQYDQGLSPVSSEKDVEGQVFEIKSGENLDAIAANLQANGLIKSVSSFKTYVKLGGASAKLKSGNYLLSKSMGVEQIVEVIVDGKQYLINVVIPPGLRLDQIAEVLTSSYDYPKSDVEKAFATASSALSFDKNGSKYRLEGLIYPDGYSMPYGSTAEEVIQQAVLQLESKIDESMLAAFKKQGLSAQEAIVLASIVQEESSKPVEQKKIARVFLNRIDKGMALGADPTFRYASFLEGIDDDVDIDSPYNTRIYQGLPPGPIANFEFSALEAVAYPADGPWLYFVAGDDGVIHYNETFEDHTRDAERYCKALCQL